MVASSCSSSISSLLPEFQVRILPWTVSKVSPSKPNHKLDVSDPSHEEFSPVLQPVHRTWNLFPPFLALIV